MRKPKHPGPRDPFLGRFSYEAKSFAWMLGELSKALAATPDSINAAFCGDLAKGLARAWSGGDSRLFRQIADLCEQHATQGVSPADWDSKIHFYVQQVFFANVRPIVEKQGRKRKVTFPKCDISKTTNDILEAAKKDGLVFEKRRVDQVVAEWFKRNGIPQRKRGRRKVKP